MLNKIKVIEDLLQTCLRLESFHLTLVWATYWTTIDFRACCDVANPAGTYTPLTEIKLSTEKLSTCSRWMWKEASSSSFCTVKLKTTTWSNKTHVWAEGNLNYTLSGVSVIALRSLAQRDYVDLVRIHKNSSNMSVSGLTLLWCNPGRCALTPHWMTTRTPKEKTKRSKEIISSLEIKEAVSSNLHIIFTCELTTHKLT